MLLDSAKHPYIIWRVKLAPDEKQWYRESHVSGGSHEWKVYIYKFSKMKLILLTIGDRWGLHVSEDAVSPLVEPMVGLYKSWVFGTLQALFQGGWG